jgi:transcriptional/translational regulatory protein YebC/TACO1
MSRFTDVDTDTKKMINEIISKDFSHLTQAKIKMVFDQKKSKNVGRYQLGKMQKSNDLIRYLTSREALDPEGFDYLMFIDENVFEVLDQPDKVRLVRHLLQYADIDFEAEKPYKIRKEEVITWYDELEFNKDDPKWFERLEVIAESIYNQDNEEDLSTEITPDNP